MQFAGPAQPLSEPGLRIALERAGFEPTGQRYIWTVCEVETADVTHGLGFRPDRRPQMLFERHVFRKLTQGRFDKEAPDLSGSQGGYGTVASQYDRLHRALDLCGSAGLGPEAALQSASWGIGQVMGFNHADAGFETGEALVEAFVQSEDAQLLGMTSFLKAKGLVELLRTQNWTAFAKAYNGQDFAKNHYDIRLAQQYERFASGSGPRLAVRCAQAALSYLGFSPGAVDGVLGERTRQALQAFRTTIDLPQTDALDPATYAALCERAGLQAV
jgi:hypothetical protein